jgi:hypothetical protein
MILLSLAIGVVPVALAACGSDDDGGCGTDSDGDDDCGTDDPSATSSTTSSSSGTGGGTQTLSCDAYCADVMANCTAENAQFETVENCVASCKAYPVGTADDQSGNTLGCRTYHAGAAASDPATHCVHAGPGGDGTCGDNCDGYCQIAMMWCTGANEVYTALADCQADCATRATDVKFDVSKDSGNEVACLLSHVQAASTVPEDHCLGDLAEDATTCK